MNKSFIDIKNKYENKFVITTSNLTAFYENSNSTSIIKKGSILKINLVKLNPIHKDLVRLFFNYNNEKNFFSFYVNWPTFCMNILEN